MRVKTTIVSSLLCAVLVLGFAMSAQASVTYQVQTSPLNAIKNGVAEVFGDVTLSVSGSPVPGPVNPNDQITVTYSLAALANSCGTTCPGLSGITVTGTGAFAVAGVLTFTTEPNVGGIGGQVTIRFANAAAFTPGASDTITIRGIRGSVVGRPIAALVITQFTAAPSGSSFFIVTSSPTVAFVVDNVSLTATSVKVATCSPSGSSVKFTVKEESPTTFVQYIGPFTPAATGRSLTLFGATVNSQVRIALGNFQNNATVYWPANIVGAQGTTTGGTLNRTSSETGSEATYQYLATEVGGQAASDNLTETFSFELVINATRTSPAPAGGEIVIPLTTPTNVTSLIWLQMVPVASSTSMPRFDDPLHPDPPKEFITTVECVTNLLFPWVGSLPSFGYDTGIAVANTGYDVGAIVPATVGDPGVIRFYFYPQTFGADPVAPTPVTSSVIKAGDTYAFPFSSFGAQKFGYLIAVCEFRFGHGFAYITQGTIGGTLDTAQGYLALVMNTGSGSTARAFPESLGE